jgi:hypothetical protein
VDTLISLTKPLLNFIHANFVNILVAIGIIIVSYLGFLATTASLRKLKVKVYSYYPFDQFFPQAGKWSIIYFLIVILLLGALIYFLGKGGFYLSPA